MDGMLWLTPRQPRLARSSTAHTRGQAGALTREPADHLYSPASFPEGAFDEIGMTERGPNARPGSEGR